MITDYNRSKLKKMNVPSQVGEDSKIYNNAYSPETTRMEVEGWRIKSGERSHKLGGLTSNLDNKSNFENKSFHGNKSTFGLKTSHIVKNQVYMKLENDQTAISTLSHSMNRNLHD